MYHPPNGQVLYLSSRCHTICPLNDPISWTSQISLLLDLSHSHLHMLWYLLSLKNKSVNMCSHNQITTKTNFTCCLICLLPLTHFSVTLQNSSRVAYMCFSTVLLLILTSTYFYLAAFCPHYSHGNCSLSKSPTDLVKSNRYLSDVLVFLAA